VGIAGCVAGGRPGAEAGHAALTLCNRTSYILYAATSAIQSPKSETQGWTRITPGDCQLARKEPLQAANYLVYARSGIAHSGPSRAWGGAYPVCVKDTNFSIKQGGDPALLLRRRHLRTALCHLGQSRQKRLDHEFRRKAGDEPGRGAACRGQAPAEGQWL
jgi:uncharacterized membrane protein